MSDTAFPSLSADLAHRVEAFETALADDPQTDLGRFLPAVGHPLYYPLLEELIRVDLDHAWGGGAGKRLAEYTTRFPTILARPEVVRAVAFEEYRQRRRAGEDARPAEYRAAYQIDTADWPHVPLGSDGTSDPSVDPDDLPRTNLVQTPLPPGFNSVVRAAGIDPDPAATGRVRVQAAEPASGYSDADVLSQWTQAAATLPEPGTTFLGFHLTEELGRGAFGRVYLATQGDLAGRPVALKIACDIVGESQTLAQLQHTNIVPLYSFHRAGPFQAVCMPYFGRTTLDQVVRHISSRPSLPHSGRELRSTLNRRTDETVPNTVRSAPRPAAAPGTPPPVASTLPAVADQPAETGQGPDGWARLAGLPYVEAVLTLGGQLADGLAHAHARGILHRDLKPANVLLTDEGRPMLLDFNLAEDVKARGSAERASVGGTLPYMAPEHIEAFRDRAGLLDGRCDLFSLGVLLFELLTGRHPYPSRGGKLADAAAAMLADRKLPPPRLRAHNPAVSAGVEAIVRKCLAPTPADRYQRAEDLREDIDRHLANRPLKSAPDRSVKERARKWVRRHPRLASSASVAVAAAALLAALAAGAVYAREQTRGLEARGRFADHQAAFRDAQAFLDDRNRSWPRLAEGLSRLREVLARYGVAEDGSSGDRWFASPAVRYLPDAEKDRVRQDVGEAFYLMAQVAHLKAFAETDPAARAALLDAGERWNDLAGRYAGDRLPRAVKEQRAALADLRGDPEVPKALRAEAAVTPAESARDRYLVGAQLARSGRHRDALPHLKAASQLDPENFSAWFVRGTTHLGLEQNELAAVCFGACTALRPDFAPAWLNRGQALTRLRLFDAARDDYDRAVALDPKLAEAFVQRAAAKGELGDHPGAVEDLTLALGTGAAPVRVHFLRAVAYKRVGKLDAAKADRAAGLRLTPADELSWIARGEARLPADPTAALADAEEALKLNPLSVMALQLKAHILAERLNRPADAVAVLNRAVEFYPDYVKARAGRGVLLARAGQRDTAVRDAKDSLLRDTRPANQYQVACIYALTAKTHPEDKAEAFRLLWAALKGGFGHEVVDTDPDLAAVRTDSEFQRLVAAAKALHATPK